MDRSFDRTPVPEGQEQVVRVTGLAGENRVELEGNLSIPAGALGIVLFAHGSGSSRHSPRNRYVAEVLQQAGLATLLMDLLTLDEERVDMRTAHLRFDIGLLASRLVMTTEWLQEHADTRELRVGYFGASTGGGAALMAATQLPEGIPPVSAVVSRGGRPDLAGAALRTVTTPTLLIVGGQDFEVIRLNEQALAQMSGASIKELAIVPGATHLFEEPGTLEQVARLARDWFLLYLNRPAS
jgi:dienelactone hydrolase